MNAIAGTTASGYGQQLIDSIEQLQEWTTRYSEGLSEAKVDSITELIMLMVQIAILTAMSFFTGGATEGDIAVAKGRDAAGVRPDAAPGTPGRPRGTFATPCPRDRERLTAVGCRSGPDVLQVRK
jgi:hypothetical protein